MKKGVNIIDLKYEIQAIILENELTFAEANWLLEITKREVIDQSLEMVSISQKLKEEKE